VLLSGGELTAGGIAAAVAELAERARDALGEPDAELDVVYELRYRGQAFELAVPAAPDAQPDHLRVEFEARHEDRYGYSDPEQQLELVTIRVSASTPGADLRLEDAELAPEPERSRRRATIGGAQRELEVFRGTPAPGRTIEGPAIVELPEATLLIPDGWVGEADRAGTLQLGRPR
jgi:N-methylhydantoinase A